MLKKEWADAIIKIGIPGVMAGFLIYWMTGEFSARLKAIEAQHVTMTMTGEFSKDLIGRSLMANERILWVLKVICANEAADREERDNCLREEP